jgi:transcriptional regulator with XRE-family HTH domain
MSIAHADEHGAKIDVKLIGRRLKQAREARGLEQEDVARLIGKSRPTISRIEHGTQTLLLPVLQDLAAVVGLSLVDLLQVATSEDTTASFPEARREQLRTQSARTPRLTGAHRAQLRAQLLQAVQLIEQLKLNVLQGLTLLG